MVLGCATSRVYVPGETYSQAEVDAAHQEREATLLARAEFEMRCTDEPLRFTCLEKQVDGFCVTAGVEGCEQRGTYVWTRTGQSQMQWVLDATNGGAPSEQAPANLIGSGPL